MRLRPRYTPEEVADAILRTQGNQRAAARALGCSSSTVQRYIHRYPLVRGAYDRACQARLKATGYPRARVLPRYSAEQMAEAVASAKGNVGAAARALGCSESTVRRYRDQKPAVRRAYEEATRTGGGARAPRPNGNQPLFTPEQMAEALWHSNGNQAAAGRALGCSGATVRHYIQRWPAVREAYDQARKGIIESGHWPSAGGRARFKPEQVAEAIRAAGGSQTKAARSLHCSTGAIREYIKRHPAVREAVDEARATILLKVENQLARAVAAGKWYAVSFVLRTLGKDRGYTTKRVQSPSREREDDELWIWIQAEYARHAAKKAGAAGQEKDYD